MTPRATLIPQVNAQTGDLLLVWDTGWLAEAIEWDEQLAGEGANPPSHVAVIAPRGMILEAIWPRVTLSPANKYAAVKTECWQLNADTLRKARAYRETQAKYLNEGYDWRGLLGMSGVELLRYADRIMRKLGLDLHVSDWLACKRRVWCSKLAGWELLQLFPDAPNYLVLDPGGVREWLIGKTPPKIPLPHPA